MKILTYDYTLIQEPGYSKNKNGNNGDNTRGYINYERQEIKIDPDHPEFMETLLHELIHAANNFWYANLNEQQVERISEGLYHILVSNGVDLTPLLKDGEDK